jgi:L-amino acid N-acyltransferase YncA
VGQSAAQRGVSLAIASSDSDFEGILALQHRYLRQALTQWEQDAEGFVYLQHDLHILRRMSAELPQAIAVAEGRVVGYCLALAVELRQEVPDLNPMFLQLARCSYLGHPLSSYRFFIGGQVCVDRDFRGRGLAGRLYYLVRRSLPAKFEVCVTEIAIRNRASLASHEGIGFRTVLNYFDGQEDWVVVAWDLSGSDD